VTGSEETSMKRAHGGRSGLTGMTGFTVVALGQFLSILGTSMTMVALTIWAWTVTGTATALAALGFFLAGPAIVFSPMAGALVDRWNRKLVMMLADMAAGVATAAILVLHLSGLLQIWHLYIAAAFAGVFQAFQFPAYTAAVALMVPKEQYGRASGMMSLAQSVGGIFAPIAAGALIGVIGVGGIMAIDLVTLALALGALLLVQVPQPVKRRGAAGAAGGGEEDDGEGNFWREVGYGFRYVLARPSLFGLQLIFTLGNLLGGLSGALASPMILARTGNDALALGTVQSAAGVGGVAGGLFMSLWGGPKRRIHGVLLGWAGTFLLGQLVMGFSGSITGWAVALFASSVCGTILFACNQSIWQSKIPPHIQGRVFSIRALIAQVASPLAMLVAGPLADYVLEPGMRPGGSLAHIFGGITGTGPGTGMSLMFIFSGVVGALMIGAAYSIRVIRDVEDLVPDFDASAQPAAVPVEDSSAAQPEHAGPVTAHSPTDLD